MARIASAAHRHHQRPEVIDAARARVRNAMVSRALAVAAQCTIVVEAMAALEKLQREVEDVGFDATCGIESISSGLELSDMIGSFVPCGVTNVDFEAVGRSMDIVRLNALRLVMECGDE